MNHPIRHRAGPMGATNLSALLRVTIECWPLGMRIANALPDADEWLALPASSVEVEEEEVLAGDLALVRRQMLTSVLKRIQACTRRAADVAV